MHLSPRWLRLLSVLRRWFCCWDSVIVLCFVVRYLILYAPSSFAIILMGKRAGCFAQFVFLVSRDCYMALPRCAMGLSAACDCGIS